MPEKPIREVSFYLLFRRHTGKVEFRQPVLAQIGALDSANLDAPDVAVFDGLLVRHTARGRAGGTDPRCGGRGWLPRREFGRRTAVEDRAGLSPV